MLLLLYYRCCLTVLFCCLVVETEMWFKCHSVFDGGRGFSSPTNMNEINEWPTPQISQIEIIYTTNNRTRRTQGQDSNNENHTLKSGLSSPVVVANWSSAEWIIYSVPLEQLVGCVQLVIGWEDEAPRDKLPLSERFDKMWEDLEFCKHKRRERTAWQQQMLDWLWVSIKGNDLATGHRPPNNMDNKQNRFLLNWHMIRPVILTGSANHRIVINRGQHDDTINMFV